MNQADPISRIASYWDEHIHDFSAAAAPVGSPEFFDELDAYRFGKLSYLPRLVDFARYDGKDLLEVGCGAGVDLLRFARGGANVTGIDLSETAIDLARRNIAQNGLTADLRVMNGECMCFADNTFDVVYAHGVLQYTADTGRMIAEIHRVLRPGGEAILMVYNRHSWLNFMRGVTNVPLEHEDAPAFRKFSVRELRQLLSRFQEYRIIPERFPARTRLHSGWKAQVFNSLFVNAFNVVPRRWTRPFGWHLMAFAVK